MTRRSSESKPQGEKERRIVDTEKLRALDAEGMLKSLMPGVYVVTVEPDGRRIRAKWVTDYYDPRSVTARVGRGL